MIRFEVCAERTIGHSDYTFVSLLSYYVVHVILLNILRLVSFFLFSMRSLSIWKHIYAYVKARKKYEKVYKMWSGDTDYNILKWLIQYAHHTLNSIFNKKHRWYFTSSVGIKCCFHYYYYYHFRNNNMTTIVFVFTSDSTPIIRFSCGEWTCT